VLKEAQKLGYAEADPTFDIEGVDAAHKVDDHDVGHCVWHSRCNLTRRTSKASPNSVPADIKYAEQLGYRIKLLAITKRTSKRYRTARASQA
jgi:homoserine dehydrogenase